MAEKSSYHLTDEDSEFAMRSKNIFGDIDKIPNSLALNKHDIKPVKGKRKAQDAKEDETPPSNNKPAYETNPEKWKKYDLSDTETSNDRQNTQVAFAFLYDVQKRRKSDEKPANALAADVDMTDDALPNKSNESHKVSFQKPSTFKMQEHVVGVSTAPKKKTVSSDLKKELCDKVELDHLENISAAEFQAEIAGKLEDSFVLKTPDESVKKTGTFKHVNKQKRNVRTRKHSENDD